MDIECVAPSECERLDGAVVVIDVLRAFTTAAFAFAAGARDILLVESLDEARALKNRFPDALTLGEDGGYPLDDFDFGNSPAELAGRTLANRRLIQRTTAGTRAAARSVRATWLVVSSFVCAEATVRYLRLLTPPRVGFVASGERVNGRGADDRACAAYLAARLRGERLSPEPFLQAVRDSQEASKFLNPDKAAFPLADLECALSIDRFDFAMVARRHEDLLILERTGG